MDKYLGHATAFGYAKSKGYTGTEEEFAELMASYATVAESAAASAESATESATTAGAAKDAAVAAKTAAETASGTATTKASEASASATSAASSASTAESASTTATAKATEAFTAAQTATTKASEASTSATAAGTAQTAAETAQTAAEDAADRAEEAAETFTTDTTLTIAGKAADAKATGDKIRNALPLETASGAVASFPDGSDLFSAEECKVSIEPVQAGTGDPSPDNVRPISGWDGVAVTKTGKNLLDSSFCTNRKQNGLTTTVNPDGSITLTGTASGGSRYWNSVDELDLVLQPGTYTLTDGLRLTSNSGNKGGTFTITEETVCFNAFFVTTSGQTYNTTIYPQLELGSTATSYEPYTGSAISVTFPIEVGTVYGGALDLVSGELVVDRAMVDLGTLTWGVQTESGTGPNGYFRSPAIENAKINSANNVPYTFGVCSALATGVPPTNIFYGNASYAIAIDANSRVRATRDDATMDAGAFKEAMSGVQLCYELAAQVTYHLTPQEVSILLGNNNIWANSGDTEVKYRADVQRYIEKKLAEIEALILEN